jgi:hypothetical protein
VVVVVAPQLLKTNTVNQVDADCDCATAEEGTRKANSKHSYEVESCWLQ